jgi:hypothetical protein
VPFVNPLQKKTDPNDAACRTVFHKVLKTAPPTSLRPEQLLKKAGWVESESKRRPSSSTGMVMSPPVSATSAGSAEFWASDDTASDDDSDTETRKRKLAWGQRRLGVRVSPPAFHVPGGTLSIHVPLAASPTVLTRAISSVLQWEERSQRSKVEEGEAMAIEVADMPMEAVGAAEALLALRWDPMR